MGVRSVLQIEFLCFLCFTQSLGQAIVLERLVSTAAFSHPRPMLVLCYVEEWSKAVFTFHRRDFPFAEQQIQQVSALWEILEQLPLIQ